MEAAFSTAWCGEFAIAKDLEASCTLVDFRAYFDFTEVEEYAKGAISYGLSMSILCLNAHMYTGPRRIKVDQAVSAQTWPRRSVVPGCTWAMTHVRYHVIDHAENFLATLGNVLQPIQVEYRLTIMVDDASIMIWGKASAIAYITAWVVSALLEWVKQKLRKTIAAGKSQCIVSSPGLRKRIQGQRALQSIDVKTHGDMLGVDTSVGGRMHTRTIQAKRMIKVAKRINRIRWWQKLTCKGMHVARTGARPQLTYGDTVVGLNNRALRILRSVHAAATRVQCAASSTIAKLATGGHDYDDIDPAVHDTAAPIIAVHSRIWDCLEYRSEFVVMWNAAV